MSIRSRSYLVLAGFASLMLVMSVGGVFAVISARTLVDRLYGNALLPSLDLKEISDGYTGAGIVTAVRVRTGDLSWEQGSRVIVDSRKFLQPAWRDYKERKPGDNNHALIPEAEARMAEADAALDELADIVDGQDVAGLSTYIARVMYPSINPLLSVIDRLATQQISDGRAIYRASTDMIWNLMFSLSVILMIAFGSFFYAASAVRLRVVGPLGDMTDAMSAVAGGDLEHEVPATERTDEIGALAKALARFRDNALSLRQLTVELREAKDRAEEATRAKSSFLAVMSHEIRTPMNGVMSMAEMLEQTELTEDQRSMSTVIRQSSGALLTIINDILDFSKIEAGRLEIEKVQFSPIELVEATAELVAARAEERGLELIVDISPDLPGKLEGDPTRIRQILLNLTGNAVKFTEQGSVTLSVSAVTAESVRFVISDTGIGLTEEQCGRLFQPFVQADASTARKYGGTGLGLSICRRLCEMMSGTIGVNSKIGHGSQFFFELPLTVLDPAPLVPEVAINDAKLIVAGFSAARQPAIEKLLAAAGIIDAEWCECLDQLPDIVPDLPSPVFLLCLSGAGQDTLRLACDGAEQSRRIILAGPRGLVSSLTEAERAGVVATLTLPLRRQRLWCAIGAALGRLRLDQRSSGDGNMAWSPPPVEEARAENALVLVAEDNATNRIVICRLLSRLGYAHEIAGNGIETLKLLERGGHGMLLTDCHMPEMDGFQLTAEIRKLEAADEDRPRLPIVALTADAMSEAAQHCLAVGMDGYLTKPIDSRALTAALESRLPVAAALRRPASSATEKKVTAPSFDPAIFDPARLSESFGALDGDAKSFFTSFLSSVPGMIEEIETGLAAGAAPSARAAAHTLKGASASVGASRLWQLAGDVQNCIDGDDLDTASLMAGLLAQTLEELVEATVSLR
ncbi:MAG: ATP-binding protein [Rhodospirillaceae bacterium]